jgi:hypothetical protein
MDSAPDTVTVKVFVEFDTTPPPPADLERITLSPITNGQVIVTGATGSVEGEARVTIGNARTGETVTVEANADGSFTAQIAVQEGDALSIVVSDEAGNTSAVVYSSVPKTPETLENEMFQSIWDSMNAALLAGDKAKALTFLTPGAQRKYGPVFDALLPYMPQIVPSYSPLQRVSVSAEIAEYAVNRTIDGQDWIFLIYFVKDPDGVWRLDAM